MSMDQLKALLGSAPKNAPAPVPVAPATPPPVICKIPPKDALTVLNGYFWDNGPAKKNRQYMWTCQMFDKTVPFTPHYRDAVWQGHARLLAPIGLIGSLKLYIKEHPGKLSEELYRDHYYPFIAETEDMEVHGEFPRIGQLAEEGSGTRYEFGYLIRVRLNDDGEVVAEILMRDGQIIRTDPGMPNPENPDGLPGKSKFICTYDPYRLRVAKKKFARK